MTPDVADVLMAIAAGDGGARSLAEARHSAEPDDRLAAALARALASGAGGDVYATPDGFRAFIDHGGNPALYDATIAALDAVHSAGVGTVVDIGSGDGRVPHAVVRRDVRRIELVEPSAALMAEALARPGWPVGPIAHRTTLDGYLTTLGPDDRLDLAQSTFALHTIEPAARDDLLARLRPHVARVAMVDFDVPAFSDRSRDHAVYAAERYRVGVGEYVDHPRAIDHFLMPVLIGQFAPEVPRVTFEQSAASWVEQFERAGFSASVRTIHDYWWAPAFLLVATPG